MTDLTGAELDLAVARIVGNDDNGIYISSTSGPMVIREFPEPMLDGVFIKQVPWRPSQGGAASWDVLEWVMSRGSVEFMRDDDECQCVWYPDDIGIVERAPTDAIALCRAVVALGEAG